jgi:NADPH-dependent 2,4-dienoyl-CoA reductase/sulfur reductase-like enzyme
MAHELTIAEISEIVHLFATSAKRAVTAGCDGVEIHGAHGYLLCEFLSSAVNKRTDRYGGGVENKARFLLETIRAVRAAVGPDYPVWCRLTAQEYWVKDGITLEETRKVARMAQEAGADAIHVSGTTAQDTTNTPETPGTLLPLATAVKKEVGVPVIAVGWLNPEIGERALEEGNADFIAFGRRLFADPEIADKASSGRTEDIRPCIGCLECMESMAHNYEPVRCAVNPALGKEARYRLKPARRKKRMIVLGGGPSGLEAARIAALRGHQVTLLEKEDKLGGQLNPAALPPYKEPISQFTTYLTRQAGKAEVEIRLNTEATVELIVENRPDVIVVATGAAPATLPIRGIDRPNVCTAVDILNGKSRAGKNVVMLGGGMVGCETGHFLAIRGHNVTIVEMMESMASDMVTTVRQRLLNRLAERNVRLLTNVVCEEIREDGLAISTPEKKRETIRAETIGIAVGFAANHKLLDSLRGMAPEIYCIGDAVQPARISDAIESGWRIGYAV